jgi:hypothetical protein
VVLFLAVLIILLPCLMWAVMEWAYRRDLQYLRQCTRVRTVRLITYWPGMESWRLAAERIANEEAPPELEVVPENAQWREPEMMPEAITMETEPEEPLKVVNITAALEEPPAPETDHARGPMVAATAPHPRRKTARMRRAAS